MSVSGVLSEQQLVQGDRAEWGEMQHTVGLHSENERLPSVSCSRRGGVPGECTQVRERMHKSETHLQGSMSLSNTDNSQLISSAGNGCRLQIGKRLRRTRVEHARELSAHNLPSGIFDSNFVAAQRTVSGQPSSPWRVAELLKQQLTGVDSLPTVLLDKDSDRPGSGGVPKVSLPEK
jgi:hypothetical protein